mmetsp:Transcript_32564/g.98298  ORF Transcript_32564/g.98298 Transcript_32564/m.98298 type:complete len:281 (+) Transcript_32564:462-1304(+)
MFAVAKAASAALRSPRCVTAFLHLHPNAERKGPVQTPQRRTLRLSAPVLDTDKFGKSHGALPEWIDDWSPTKFFGAGVLGVAGSAFFLVTDGVCFESVVFSGLVAAYWSVGLNDMRQKSHAIRRNFPVLGNARYLLESIRPNIRQSFIESDTEKSGVPFDRAHRALAYQRAKALTDTVPLGTKRDVYDEGYTYAMHSMFPKHVEWSEARVTVGNHQCKQPYSASLLNISGMSYGSLSENAIMALNLGAKLGGFYHNTGEGGISEFHLKHGGDLVWNIGTG